MKIKQIIVTNLPLTLPLGLVLLISLNTQLSELIFPSYSPYDIQRILEVGLLILIGLMIIFIRSVRLRWLNIFYQFSQLIRMMIAAIFLLGIISAFFAPVLKMAVLEVVMLLLLVGMMLFVAAERVQNQRAFEMAILGVLLFSIVVYEGSFFYDYYGKLGLVSSIGSFPSFVNPRFLGHFQTWTLPLVSLPIYFIDRKKILIQGLIYIVVALWWAIEFAEGAKGSWLGLLVGIIFAAVIFWKQIAPWLWVQLQLIILGALLYWIFFVYTMQVSYFDFAINDISSGRTVLWWKVWMLIKNHLWLGVGPMHGAYYRYLISAHPHNSLLQIGLEWGLPVLLLVVVLFFDGVIAWVKFCKPKPIHIGLTVVLIAGSVHSLVCGIIVTPLSQIMLALVLGWIIGDYFSASTKSPIELPTKRSLVVEILLIIIILLAFLGVYAGIVPDVFRLTKLRHQWVEQELIAHHHDYRAIVYFPRFWNQGWIDGKK